MEVRQRLGAQERRRKKLVLGSDLDPLTCEMEDDAAVDDESGHLAIQAIAQPPSISGSTAVDSDESIAACAREQERPWRWHVTEARQRGSLVEERAPA